MLINFLPLCSDGSSTHLKDNVSLFNLIHHQTDLGLHACWTSTATGHGKGAGDGVGAVLKLDVLHSRRIFFYLCRRISISSRDNINLKQPTYLTKPVLLLSMSSSLKQKQSNRSKLLLSRQEVNRLNHQVTKVFPSSDRKNLYIGAIQGIRAMYEFQPINNHTARYRPTSDSTQINTFSF